MGNRRALIRDVLFAVGAAAILTTAIPVVDSLTDDAPPAAEDLTYTAVRLPEPGLIEAQLQNGGTEDVTISQVLVDNAFREFSIDGSASVGRLRSRTVSIPYPWIPGESHTIRVLTSTGATFDSTIEVATVSPIDDSGDLLSLGLIGLYIGVVSVGAGLIFFPRIRRAGKGPRMVMVGVTLGLVVFLAAEAYLESLDLAESVPTALDGRMLVPLVFFVALLAVSMLWRSESSTGMPSFRLASGIGLHNAGEGLAVGTALATGRTALGLSLIIGFALHNITEGVAIADAAATDKRSIGWVVVLGLVAGVPAIPGAIAGGAVISNTYHAVFLAIAAAALLMVAIEIVKTLRANGTWQDRRLIWGVLAGVAFLYLTGLLISV